MGWGRLYIDTETSRGADSSSWGNNSGATPHNPLARRRTGIGLDMRASDIECLNIGASLRVNARQARQFPRQNLLAPTGRRARESAADRVPGPSDDFSDISGCSLGKDPSLHSARVTPKNLQSKPAGSSIPASGSRHLKHMALMVAKTIERPYTEAELNRTQLIALVVEHQCTNWKGTASQLSKENMQNLRKSLRDPSLGFMFLDPSMQATPTSHCLDVASFRAQFPTAFFRLFYQCFRNTNSRKTVQLFIADRRGTFEVSHTLQSIEVSVADFHNCKEGEWHAKAAEILHALQESIARLKGSGRLGVADRDDLRYTEYFVKLIADKDIVSAVTNPDATTRVKQPTTKEIAWLKEKLQALRVTFQANHNKVLQMWIGSNTGGLL
ncbi:hypothetical protein C8J57DRAFT_1241622 [Mycena rebaudengoi]|nr:hypothetical protein C8J57DRAFT_1241622 [Mycena rebaudengoi]